MADVRRVVALGASNLTRGFQTVVATSRAAWGPGVEVLAALGHGRSYGAASRVAFRTLPGILDSGLWRELDARPPVATRALVTDVGNDILYGFSAEQILAWVAQVLVRFRALGHDVVVTSLPLAAVRRLSNAKFLVVRSLLFPSCRLPLARVLATAERVDAGLAELATAYGATFARLDPAWYGVDPIHIRPSLWRPAWQSILGARADVDGGPPLEGVKLYFMAPERRWLFGVEQHTPQSGTVLPAGGRVWLY